MTGQDSDQNLFIHRETAAWYKDIVDHARDMIQCVDSEGRFIYVNQAWLSTLNYTVEETDHLTLWNVIHPDSMEHCKAVFKQALTGETNGEVEAVFVTKDGSPVKVVGNIGVKLDEKGRFVHTRGIFRDVKRAEAALLKSEEEHRRLFETMAQGVVYHSADGKIISANPSAERILGLTAEQMQGKTTMDLRWQMIKEDGTAVAGTDHPTIIALRTGQIVGPVTRGVLHPGENSHIWLSITAIPLFQPGEKEPFQAHATFEDITERKAAEEQLQAVSDNIPDGLVYQLVIDPEGRRRFNYISAGVEQIGVTQAEALENPQAIYEKLHIDDIGILFEAEQKAFATLDPFKCETRLRGPDGEIRWVQMRSSLKKKLDGSIVCDGICIDITERKRAEEALRKSEQELKTVTENMTDIVAMANPDGKFSYLSESNYRLLGYRPVELLGKSIMDLIHEDDLSKTVALFQEGMAGSRKSARVEYRTRRKDGGYIWVETIGSRLLDDEGQPSGALFTSRDISDRKQAEEALKESEQKHREILEAMAEGYYEVDLAGTLVFCNESFCKMTGYSYDELMGESYTRFYINPQEVFQAFNQVYKTGKPVTATDWPAINRDGRKGHLELSVSLRRDEKGQPIGFRGVVRDITERRRADAKIRYLSYHDQLTGLYNRHYLEEEMERLNTKRQLPISIIMADLNGLKLVNDTIGHLSGDEMLKRAAAILSSVCREDDLLARFGGDEFVIYLPRTPEKEAQKICSRIEKACRKELINDVPLSLSTGVAVKVSAEHKLLDVLGVAEDNMYRDKLTESRSGKSAVVNSLLQTLAAKSFETEAHTRNMQETAKNIGEKLGLPTSELSRLSLLITLHDIGKINIPEALLTKKGSLSAAEWEIMKKHSETGYRIAKATDNFAHVAEDILAHHERWDGSGYPQGLKGEAIPILARITAIADAFEVMSNGRPYKKEMSRSKIKTEFEKCSGKHFDPSLAKLFLLILDSESEPAG